MTKMLSGDVASGTKHVLVWQQFGSMAQTLSLGSSHCHQPVVGSLAAVRITSSVKEKAMKDFYQPAGNIVQEVLLEELNSAPCPAMPKVANLVRQANRRRQKSRPVEPQDLKFELNPEHIPGGFLQADVKVGSQRHLVFSTEQMLTLLARSKQWYVVTNSVY